MTGQMLGVEFGADRLNHLDQIWTSRITCGKQRRVRFQFLPVSPYGLEG